MSFLSFFRSPIIQPDNKIDVLRSSFIESMHSQSILTKTISYLIKMTDHMPVEMGMWVKDTEHRYIYANKVLRDILFNGCDLPAIIGRTDAQLIGEESCNIAFLKKLTSDLTPDDLPLLDKMIPIGTRICNLTDIITAQFNKECHFVETIGDVILYVKKYPLQKEVKGTVGYSIDITLKKDEITCKIKDLILHGKAFQIDGLQSWYIKDGLCVKDIING